MTAAEPGRPEHGVQLVGPGRAQALASGCPHPAVLVTATGRLEGQVLRDPGARRTRSALPLTSLV